MSLRDYVSVAALRNRLLEVRAGAIEGARQAKRAYAEGLVSPPEPASPPVDPKIAGYYANLEVEVGADLEAVTRAWKKLVREFHPDRFAGHPAREAEATRLVQQLNDAYRELSAYLGKSRQPRK